MASQQTAARAQSNQNETRASKIYQNMQNTHELHAQKTQKSNANFQNARITSCSGVLMKNGHAVALCFNSSNPKPIDIAAMKSSETASVAQ